MTERHDIILRQHEDKTNPPDLLRQIIQDVKKLVPETGKSARKWMRAKGDQELAKVQEIKARVYEKIGQLEIERQRLIQQRDEDMRKAELERQRQQDEHDRDMREQEIHIFKERTQALREVVDCIVRLKEKGIEVDLELIETVGRYAMQILNDT